MAMCVECGGTGTVFALGGMKIQCPICEGKRIVDYQNKNFFIERHAGEIRHEVDFGEKPAQVHYAPPHIENDVITEKLKNYTKTTKGILKNERKKPKKHPGGRPTKYNEKIAQLICDRVATHDCGLKKLCDMYDDMPDMTTVYEWRYRYEEFSKQYAQAKLKQAELLAESIDEIAVEKCVYYDEDGNERIDPGGIAEKRLRIDTRKWLASKLIPKTYGDRTTNETTVTIKHEDALKELE